MEGVYWVSAIIVGIAVAILGWQVGYKHVKIRVWALLLFMILGTPLSVLLYMDGANKAKRDGKTIPQKQKIERAKHPFNFHDAISIRKCAIIISIVTAVLIVLSLIFIPVSTNKTIENAEKNSESISVGNYNSSFNYGAINKQYTAYLIEGTALDSNNYESSYYFIFQFVNGKIRCYRTSTGNRNKAAILNYFNHVHEEKPSAALVLGAWFYLDLFVCILTVVATLGLWGWWYYLFKHKQVKAIKVCDTGCSIGKTASNSG